VLKTEKGRSLFDRYILNLPVFGLLLLRVAVAKFTRTMGTMLASGVAILDALDITAKTAGNKTVEAAIYKVRQGIAEGRTNERTPGPRRGFPRHGLPDDLRRGITGALDTMPGQDRRFLR
jgi:type IV pilus assembly protein PilC